MAYNEQIIRDNLALFQEEYPDITVDEVMEELPLRRHLREIYYQIIDRRVPEVPRHVPLPEVPRHVPLPEVPRPNLRVIVNAVNERLQRALAFYTQVEAQGWTWDQLVPNINQGLRMPFFIPIDLTWCFSGTYIPVDRRAYLDANPEIAALLVRYYGHEHPETEFATLDDLTPLSDNQLGRVLETLQLVVDPGEAYTERCQQAIMGEWIRLGWRRGVLDLDTRIRLLRALTNYTAAELAQFRRDPVETVIALIDTIVTAQRIPINPPLDLYGIFTGQAVNARHDVALPLHYVAALRANFGPTQPLHLMYPTYTSEELYLMDATLRARILARDGSTLEQWIAYGFMPPPNPQEVGEHDGRWRRALNLLRDVDRHRIEAVIQHFNGTLSQRMEVYISGPGRVPADLDYVNLLFDTVTPAERARLGERLSDRVCRSITRRLGVHESRLSDEVLRRYSTVVMPLANLQALSQRRLDRIAAREGCAATPPAIFEVWVTAGFIGPLPALIPETPPSLEVAVRRYNHFAFDHLSWFRDLSRVDQIKHYILSGLPIPVVPEFDVVTAWTGIHNPARRADVCEDLDFLRVGYPDTTHAHNIVPTFFLPDQVLLLLQRDGLYDGFPFAEDALKIQWARWEWTPIPHLSFTDALNAWLGALPGRRIAFNRFMLDFINDEDGIRENESWGLMVDMMMIITGWDADVIQGLPPILRQCLQRFYDLDSDDVRILQTQSPNLWTHATSLTVPQRRFIQQQYTIAAGHTAADYTTAWRRLGLIDDPTDVVLARLNDVLHARLPDIYAFAQQPPMTRYSTDLAGIIANSEVLEERILALTRCQDAIDLQMLAATVGIRSNVVRRLAAYRGFMPPNMGEELFHDYEEAGLEGWANHGYIREYVAPSEAVVNQVREKQGLVLGDDLIFLEKCTLFGMDPHLPETILQFIWYGIPLGFDPEFSIDSLIPLLDDERWRQRLMAYTGTLSEVGLANFNSYPQSYVSELDTELIIRMMRPDDATEEEVAARAHMAVFGYLQVMQTTSLPYEVILRTQEALQRCWTQEQIDQLLIGRPFTDGEGIPVPPAQRFFERLHLPRGFGPILDVVYLLTGSRHPPTRRMAMADAEDILPRLTRYLGQNALTWYPYATAMEMAAWREVRLIETANRDLEYPLPPEADPATIIQLLVEQYAANDAGIPVVAIPAFEGTPLPTPEAVLPHPVRRQLLVERQIRGDEPNVLVAITPPARPGGAPLFAPDDEIAEEEGIVDDLVAERVQYRTPVNPVNYPVEDVVVTEEIVTALLRGQYFLTHSGMQMTPLEYIFGGINPVTVLEALGFLVPPEWEMQVHVLWLCAIYGAPRYGVSNQLFNLADVAGSADMATEIYERCTGYRVTPMTTDVDPTILNWDRPAVIASYRYCLPLNTMNSPYRALTAAQTSHNPAMVLTTFVRQIAQRPLEDVVRRLGILYPGSITTPIQRYQYVMNNLRSYLNAFARRSSPSLLTASELTNHQTAAVALSMLTDVELSRKYPFEGLRWTSRNDLIRRLSHLITSQQPRWTLLQVPERRRNPRTSLVTLLDLMYGDPTDPVLSYGSFLEYRSFNTSELVTTFAPSDGVFTATNPSFTGTAGNDGYVDELQSFPVNTMQQLQELLMLTHDPVFIPLLRAIDGFLREQDIHQDYLREVRRSLNALTVADRAAILRIGGLIFLSSMYARFWGGPGRPWPYLFIEHADMAVDAVQRDLRYTESVATIDAALTAASANVQVIITNLHVINFQWSSLTPLVTVNRWSDLYALSKENKMCLADLSDRGTRTAYAFLVTIAEMSLEQFNAHIIALTGDPSQEPFTPGNMNTSQHVDPALRLERAYTVVRGLPEPDL